MMAYVLPVFSIEAMNMIRKGQVKGISRGESVSQIELVNELFGVGA
jgi:hypothetical protein